MKRLLLTVAVILFATGPFRPGVANPSERSAMGSHIMDHFKNVTVSDQPILIILGVNGSGF